ncbi:MAG: serine/threonine protein kinase [Streptomyces sp.]|nr:serine/threonine protein kinase [Streptomyces sp.]
MPGGVDESWLVPDCTEVRQLGAGATGRVILARRGEADDLVVIKYLSRDLVGGADAATTKRIRSELSSLVGMRDPNVVRVDEVISSPAGGDIAVAMEAVDGATLRTLLSARSLAPEAGLALLRGSLLGLAAVHERGVVHRDHKPDNVLVDPAGQCRLINAGIPAPADDADPHEGTTAYRAPELWRGALASPASDVYAAAVTFFECLTGHQPFHDAAGELRGLHESVGVPLDDLPEPVRPLVERAMAKDPEDRYSDARSFAAALDAVAGKAYGPQWLERGTRSLADAAEIALSAQPLLARGGFGASADGAAGRPWWKRRRTQLAAAGIVAVVAVVLVLVLNGGGGKQEVRKPFDQALAALAKAPGVRYQDHDRITGYYDVTVTATGERFGYQGETADFSGKVDQALVTVGGQDFLSFKNDPVTKGWAYDPGGDEKNMGPMLKTYVTPGKLAAELTRALSQRPRLPDAGDKKAAAVTVNGTPAWQADTVDGYLYVTQSAPYRVLRWEPPNTATVQKVLKGNPTAPQPRSLEAHTPLSDSLGMDLTPITDTTRVYGTVIEDTRSLTTAEVGASVQIIEKSGGGSNVRCSHEGCRVNEVFSGPVFNATSKVYALSKVYIELKVGSITTGGEQVGGCSSGRQPYPLAGHTLAGKLTCNNAQAGATFDKVSAQNQDVANANGHSTFWDYADDIHLHVYVFSPADIDQLVAKEQHELQSHG